MFVTILMIVVIACVVAVFFIPCKDYTDPWHVRCYVWECPSCKKNNKVSSYIFEPIQNHESSLNLGYNTPRDPDNIKYACQHCRWILNSDMRPELKSVIGRSLFKKGYFFKEEFRMDDGRIVDTHPLLVE